MGIADLHSNHSEKYIFTSQLPRAPIPDNLTIPEYVLQDLDVYAHKIAVVDASDGRQYTYKEVGILVNNVAGGLIDLGLQKGDVVFVLLPNVAEYFILVLGIMSAGAVFSGCNPSSHPLEIQKHIQNSEAKVIITNAANFGKLGAVSHLPVILHGEQIIPGTIPVNRIFQADPRKFPIGVSISQDDICALPYSSGTTGASKGVMITHRNIISNLSQTLQDMEKIPREERLKGPQYCTLGMLPFFHIYGIAGIGFSTMRMKGKVVVMERYDLRKLLLTLIKYEVNFAPLVPPIILSLVKDPIVNEYDLKNLKLDAVMTAAAPLASELQNAFEHKFPRVEVRQAYGLTEYSCVTLSHCGPGHARGIAKRGSVGFLIPDTEMKFIDPETGHSLPANSPGEICVRGGATMKGYLKNPDATKATIDEQGWLHTGDVGYIDDDGDIFVVDRVKELIKYKGFQVPPAELEAILISHPSIEDVAVIPFPDQEAGEIPLACVVRKPESEITKEDIYNFVASQVTGYKKVRRVEFMDSIPKSSSGKILRRQVRATLMKRL
ncbi:hypothetical protein O6H91_01G034100 [Diphasiastrum complanatum]|uniref:Uncharacterized protein n=4 Tax=Diphasiastrum complanatum TaxID=34168 RepID=A0ACC2EPR3_DIPCM|nr:hypothetical protein O6H91_01G034100 [Diphasiastrum complanatum]KAJ7568479.1 hypothetical protein O6H91_01G034100 [Diphasiastrum complanatum]KAJ7568481.1 hypothetical protein O6H91_01G034100 [Diphasiastrum complanatum]KAJ7568482.1 hypothetical protein O6H91_01G034100 [Diphasiastrum complanatum]